MTIAERQTLDGGLRPPLTPRSELGRLAPVERYLTRLDAVGCRYWATKTESWRAQCPSHDDQNPSLSIGLGDDGRALVKCFAGCTFAEINEALGLPSWAAFAGAAGKGKSPESKRLEALAVRHNLALFQDPARLAEVEDEYGWPRCPLDDFLVGRNGDYLSYPERDGSEQIVGIGNYLPKSRRGRGKSRHKSEGRRGLLYSALGIARGTRVVIVEGAPSALAVRTLDHDVIGYPGGGTGAIPVAWWRALVRDCECIVFPDADAPGQRAADVVVDAIRPVAGSVAVVVPPLAKLGLDWADVLRMDLRRGRGPEATAAQLEEAITKAKPLPRVKRGRPPSQREEAERYLRQTLSDGQRHPSNEVEKNLPEGISKRTCQTVRAELKARGEIRVGKDGKTGQWWLQLSAKTESETAA